MILVPILILEFDLQIRNTFAISSDSTCLRSLMLNMYHKLTPPMLEVDKSQPQRVFAWNSSELNPVGAPYILMENVEGILPSLIWSRASESQKLQILDHIAEVHAAFAKPLPFSLIGNIHFSSSLTNQTSTRLGLVDPTLYRVGHSHLD